MNKLSWSVMLLTTYISITEKKKKLGKDKNQCEARGRTEKATNCQGLFILLIPHFHHCLSNAVTVSSPFLHFFSKLSFVCSWENRQTRDEEKLFYTFYAPLNSKRWSNSVWEAIWRTLIPNCSNDCTIPQLTHQQELRFSTHFSSI